MTLETAMNNVLSAVLILLATAAAVAIRQGAVWIERYARERIGNDRYSMVKEMALTVVRSLEQTGIWRQLDAKGKKEHALLYLQFYAEQLGMNIDIDELDHMIEAAVNVMNAELNKDEISIMAEAIDPRMFSGLPGSVAIQ